MDPKNTPATAGFWSRATSGLIDALVVTAFVWLAASVLGSSGYYIPIEATIIAGYALYTTIAFAWKGQTLGCRLCGNVLLKRDGSRLSIVRTVFRSLLVTLFQFLLGLPFLIVAAKKTKRGWQDVLTGSTVQRLPENKARQRWAVTILWLGVLLWIGLEGTNGWDAYQTQRKWTADAESYSMARTQDRGSPIEASSLSEQQKDEMTAWLLEHGREPEEYIIDLAARHQVTLIGEIHGKKQYLQLLNRLLPDLYASAKVRTLALECCRAQQNDDIARLITGDTFDRERAKKIARESVWSSWAWKGYWDALETAWRLNQGVPNDDERLNVVGIAPSVDLPSLALVKQGPPVEKLRLLRLISRPGVFCDLIYHDAFYASCVEKAAFDGGRRTVVWVGAAHVHPPFSTGTPEPGHAVAKEHRMGAMLIGRYGDQIGQVTLHQDFAYGEVARLIEQVAPDQPSTGLAFRTADSPFANLRDPGSTASFKRYPNLRFSDLTSSYLFLVPEADLKTCDRIDGFITPSMFGRNKPFYELLLGHKLKNYHDANQDLSAGLMRM